MNQFKPERLPVGWPWRFFSVSLFIFLAAFFVYAGLLFGWEPYLNSQIQKKDEAIGELAGKIPAEERERFIQFYSQLMNLKTLLSNHSKTSQVFPLLEQLTNKKVYYKAASLKVLERTLELDGAADSYETLAEQLESFRQSEKIENFALTQSQLLEETVQFRTALKLKEGLLK